MKCEYSDGIRVSYSGPLQITKTGEVNVFIKETSIPDDIRSDLDMALYKNSCGDLRRVADAVTERYGKKACVHE